MHCRRQCPRQNRLVRGVLHSFAGVFEVFASAMCGSAPCARCYQQQRREQTVDESFHA